MESVLQLQDVSMANIQESIIHFKGKSKYTFPYSPKRVCIPIGMACNLKCSYCMRNAGTVKEPKGLSDVMKEFLKQLNPSTTEAVIINGGEPLLYIDRIKEVFSLVPKEIHKAVMTNGTLLTQEFVDYLNSIGGELHFSHEGLAAEELKGVDILKDQYYVDLLNQVKLMRLYTIITAKNPDVVANYEYITSKINKVENLWFTPFPMFAFVKENECLTNGFDFETYGRSLIELWEKYPKSVGRSSHHARYIRNNGMVVLPDGSVASLCTLRIYGTVQNTKKELVERAREMGEFDWCEAQDCAERERCVMAKQLANPFTCKAQRVHLNALSYLETFNVL